MQHFCARGGWRAVLLVGTGLAVIGCGSSRKGGQPVGSTTAGATSGALPGTGPGGSGGTQARGPALAITSPAGASWVQGPKVLVEGTVSDRGSGVGAVTVNGVPATLQGERFQADLTVEPGLQTIVVEARDGSGQATSSRHVSVIVGDTLPEDQLVPAAAARLTDLALDTLEPGLATALEGQRAAITQQVLTTRIPDVQLTGFSYGRATPALDCVPGGLRMTVQMEQVRLGIAVEAGFLFFKQTYRGDVTAQRLTIEGTAMATVQNGQPVVSLGNVTAQAAGFAVPSFASDQAAKIQQQFQQAFANAAKQNLASALQQGLQAALLSGQSQQTLLGRQLTAEWKLTALTFDQDGVTAALAANVTAQQRTRGDAAPGSFSVGGDLPSMVGAGGVHNVAIAIHQDALNRTLHAAWRAGALSQDLGQAQLDQLATGYQGTMTTTTLMSALPQLQGKLMPGLPLALTMEGELPVVASIADRAQAQLELAIGELHLKLVLQDPQAGPVTLVEAVIAGRIPARLVGQGGEVRVEPAGQPELLVDVVGEQIPGTEELLEQLAAQATGPALLASLTNVQGMVIPAVQGFQLGQVDFSTVQHSLVAQGKVSK